MSLIFVLLFLLSLAGLVLGLINPAWIRMPSRKRAALFTGGAMLLSFVLFTTTAPPIASTEIAEQPKPQVPVGLEANSVIDQVGTASDRYAGKTYKVETFTGDGVNNVLLLKASYDDITVRLNGVVQTMGTYKGSASCGDGNDVCYDFANRKLYFVQKPAKGASIVVQGYPQ